MARLAVKDSSSRVRCLSERDFLFPDADEKYVPEVLAYIHNYDVETLNRALYDQWAGRLAAGCKRLPPHIMECMQRQRFNGHAGDDTPGAFDA